jgi:hypothetical protein
VSGVDCALAVIGEPHSAQGAAELARTPVLILEPVKQTIENWEVVNPDRSFLVVPIINVGRFSRGMVRCRKAIRPGVATNQMKIPMPHHGLR